MYSYATFNCIRDRQIFQLVLANYEFQNDKRNKWRHFSMNNVFCSGIVIYHRFVLIMNVNVCNIVYSII